ncbi:MAG: energy transducer TonB [Leptolyngbya sp.]|nr:energy transducer TonB [Leptolyngbya sp.]
MALPLWSDRPRDPVYLWPASVLVALVLHGVGIGMLMQREGGAAPAVARVALVPVTPEGQGQASLPAVTLPTTPASAPVGTENAAIAPAPPSTAATPTPATPATPNATGGAAAPSPAPPPAIDNGGDRGDGAGSGQGNGFQSWWSLGPLPGGRDIPDALPQLPGGWQIRVLQISDYPQCLSPGMIAATATVGLQLTVSAQGEVLAARVAQPSGYDAYDRAMVCVLENRPFTLDPATSRDPATGVDVPVPTDAALLTITSTVAPGADS